MMGSSERAVYEINLVSASSNPTHLIRQPPQSSWSSRARFALRHSYTHGRCRMGTCPYRWRKGVRGHSVGGRLGARKYPSVYLYPKRGAPRVKTRMAARGPSRGSETTTAPIPLRQPGWVSCQMGYSPPDGHSLSRTSRECAGHCGWRLGSERRCGDRARMWA